MVGARPQFIKAAPLSRAIADRNLIEILVHTGQHFDRDMSDIFFEELGIRKPDHILGVHGGTQGEMTGRMIIALERVVLDEKPDAVLIYGDTNSTLAGAIAAAKLYIPIAHVEAGLRSYRPMPEEINRILADRVSRWLFCPTDTAIANLACEGIKKGVHAVGDVMYDATVIMRERARSRSSILLRLGLLPGQFQLATLHRAENTDTRDALERAFAYLQRASRDLPIILPLHPRTRNAAASFGIEIRNIRVIEPVGYLDMIALLDGCTQVLTDWVVCKRSHIFSANRASPCETRLSGWKQLKRDGIDFGSGQTTPRVA